MFVYDSSLCYCKANFSTNQDQYWFMKDLKLFNNSCYAITVGGTCNIWYICFFFYYYFNLLKKIIPCFLLCLMYLCIKHDENHFIRFAKTEISGLIKQRAAALFIYYYFFTNFEVFENQMKHFNFYCLIKLLKPSILGEIQSKIFHQIS